ncbi:hypothetical protein LZ30DRAFT_695993 [Colletotrichum cereale]|nr:hypothetical protein LZ30DRAFT_695993 [Colletotrichum cereale]
MTWPLDLGRSLNAGRRGISNRALFRSSSYCGSGTNEQHPKIRKRRGKGPCSKVRTQELESLIGLRLYHCSTIRPPAALLCVISIGSLHLVHLVVPWHIPITLPGPTSKWTGFSVMRLFSRINPLPHIWKSLIRLRPGSKGHSLILLHWHRLSVHLSS